MEGSREVALMRRILLLAPVAVMMAAMLVVPAGEASATIHSISCADHAREGTPAHRQEPPGITINDFNGNNADERQPVNSVRGNDTANENARLKKAERCGD
jgi:hypothetical protein